MAISAVILSPTNRTPLQFPDQALQLPPLNEDLMGTQTWSTFGRTMTTEST